MRRLSIEKSQSDDRNSDLYCFPNRAPSPAFAAEMPYVVTIVEIDEGPLLMTNVVGSDSDQVKIGMNVRAMFRQVADAVALPVFEPK